ncbi:uncharacterized protein [Coffea arabica]|uniref:Uncharacterized protein n=1 Tax=Coffea arabica TaxID=13443 RepID=A0ABM4WNN9_COFAR
MLVYRCRSRSTNHCSSLAHLVMSIGSTNNPNQVMTSPYWSTESLTSTPAPAPSSADSGGKEPKKRGPYKKRSTIWSHFKEVFEEAVVQLFSEYKELSSPLEVNAPASSSKSGAIDKGAMAGDMDAGKLSKTCTKRSLKREK